MTSALWRRGLLPGYGPTLVDIRMMEMITETDQEAARARDEMLTLAVALEIRK